MAVDPRKPFTRRAGLESGIPVRQLTSAAYRRLFHGVYVGSQVKVTLALRTKAALLVCTPSDVRQSPHGGSSLGWLGSAHGADPRGVPVTTIALRTRRYRESSGARRRGADHEIRCSHVPGRAGVPGSGRREDRSRRPGGRRRLARPRVRGHARGTCRCGGKLGWSRLSVGAAGSPMGTRGRRLGHGDPSAHAHRACGTAGADRRSRHPARRRHLAAPNRPRLPRAPDRHRVRRAPACREHDAVEQGHPASRGSREPGMAVRRRDGGRRLRQPR